MTAYTIAGAITYSLGFAVCIGMACYWYQPPAGFTKGDSLFVLPLMFATAFCFGAVWCIARLCGVSD